MSIIPRYDYLALFTGHPPVFTDRRLWPLCLLLLLAVLFGGTGCAQNADQADFEARAFRSPEGITRTDESEKVIGADPDDWQVSPDFAHRVWSVGPAWPNPAELNAEVRVELEVRPQAVNGLRLYGDPYSCGLQSDFQLLDEEDGLLPAGYTVLRFPVAALRCSGAVTVTTGLRRLFVMDHYGNLISYGDIEIR